MKIIKKIMVSVFKEMSAYGQFKAKMKDGYLD